MQEFIKKILRKYAPEKTKAIGNFVEVSKKAIVVEFLLP